MSRDELGGVGDLGILDVPADDGAGLVLALGRRAQRANRRLRDRRQFHASLFEDDARPGADLVANVGTDSTGPKVERQRLYGDAPEESVLG